MTLTNDEVLIGNFNIKRPKLFEIPKLEQINTEQGRYYLLEGSNTKFYSVTGMLGDDPEKKKGLQKWRNKIGSENASKISKFASSRGTRLHDLFEQYLSNLPIQKDEIFPHVNELFVASKPILDSNITAIHALEERLYSKKLQLAGTVDGIIEWNGKLSIIDFKTSKKTKEKKWILDYFLQCSAYSLMLKEITNIKIDQIIIFIAVDGKKYPQVFIESATKYSPLLLKRVFEYFNRNNIAVPPIFENL
jgi:genome maintenance exonuclease 1